MTKSRRFSVRKRCVATVLILTVGVYLSGNGPGVQLRADVLDDLHKAFYGQSDGWDFSPLCTESPHGKELTLFGHSRLWPLATLQGLLIGAKVPGGETNIIREGSVTGIQNLVWPGSHATSSFPISQETVFILQVVAISAFLSAFAAWGGPLGLLVGAILLVVLAPKLQKILDKIALLAQPPTESKDWNVQLARCLSDGLPYRTTPHVVTMLGGNDMIRFYKQMEGHEALYLILHAIANPIQFVKDLIRHGEPGQANHLFLEAFWLWQFEAKEDQIVEGVKSTTRYHLDNLNPNFLPIPNQVLIVSDPPVLSAEPGMPTQTWFFTNSGGLKGFFRFNYYLARLRDKMMNGMFGAFANFPYSGRVHFLDAYSVFATAILRGDISYYMGGDGIHLGDKGNIELGRMIAAKSVQIGWFPASEGVALPQLSAITTAQTITMPNTGGDPTFGGTVFGFFREDSCAVEGSGLFCGLRWFEAINIKFDGDYGQPCLSGTRFYSFTQAYGQAICDIFGNCTSLSADGHFGGPPTSCAALPPFFSCEWNFGVTVRDCSDPVKAVTKNVRIVTGL